MQVADPARKIKHSQKTERRPQNAFQKSKSSLLKSFIKAELVKPPRLGGLVKVALFLLFIVGNASFFPAPII